MSSAPEASPFDPAAVDAVVIGASAGGIDALNRLLPGLPEGFGPAVLVVVHVRPDTPSLLPGIFGARCRLRVVEPNDKDEIAPGMIYLAPPGYHMMVERDRSIALSVDPPVRFSRPSVDVLFESAAHVYRDTLLASCSPVRTTTARAARRHPRGGRPLLGAGPRDGERDGDAARRDRERRGARHSDTR